MKVDLTFMTKKFEAVSIGEFFLHPFDGGHGPSIKAEAADGSIVVVDLCAEQPGAKRLPQIIRIDAFENATVIAVPAAAIALPKGLGGLVNGASGRDVPTGYGSIAVTDTSYLLRVKSGLQTLTIDLATGAQVTGPETSSCSWTNDWQIVVGDKEDRQVLFQHGTP